MSTHLTAPPPFEVDDDRDPYVLMDPRAVLLDLPEEPAPMERPRLRGAQLRAAQEPRRQTVGSRTLFDTPRPTTAGTTTSSLWHRLARRIRGES